MKYLFVAIDKDGKAVRDSVEANGVGEAGEMLRKRGLYVTEIGEASAMASAMSAAASAGRRVGGTGKKLKNLALFCRQLHVLVATGTPLVQALTALERQVQDVQWQRVVGALRAKVEEGASLSGAMADFPDYFDTVCRSLVAAGESAGNFDVMLDRLAVLTKKQVHVRQSVTGAMVYPALLVLVSVGVLCVMLGFVLPRFEDLFKTLDTPLPPTTKVLMGLSKLMVAYWWGALAGVVGGVVGLKYWLGSAQGKRATDTILLRAPSVGKITKSFCTARVTRLLGTLIESKVPLLDALQLTGASCSNYHYADLLKRAEDSVTRGEPIAKAFEVPSLIHPSVCEAIRNGEASGRVGSLLLNMSEFLDEENEVVVKSLTSIIEPMILIVLGVLVGFVAVSMFLPLFDLTSATRGGG